MDGKIQIGLIMKKYIKLILINAIVFLLLLEITSIVYFKLNPNRLPTFRVPTYLDLIFKNQNKFTNPPSPRLIDTLYSWCTWHPRNTSFRQISNCYDVIYKFNKMGTRGLLPDPNDSNTIFFLGDSFAEGAGLEEDSTISERIRKLTHKQVLNLGSSGGIGTTQMSLIYEEFSKSFQHKDVFVLFFLNNDFIDNDINCHPANRYRPYRIILKDDSSKIVYKGNVDSTNLSWNAFFIKLKMRDKLIKENKIKTKNNILKFTYSYRLLYMITNNIIRAGQGIQKPYELRYNDHDLKIVELDIRNIIKTASKNNAKVYFMNLPSKSLLESTDKSPEIAEEYKILERKLSSIIKNENGIYLSFYEYIIKMKINFHLMFFTCEDHYSNYGESVLADFIYSQYSKK
jgi:hypothetical protein